MRGQPLTKEQQALQKPLPNLQQFQDQPLQQPKQIHTQSSLQSSSTVSQSGHRHDQQIQVMQKQFQAVIRGYQIKLKNVGEEYKRFKHEMQIKMKKLYQEKNHWHNLVMEHSGKIENAHNFHKVKDKPEQSNQQLLHFELARQRETIDTVEREKRNLQKEKEGYIKELDRLKNENNNLKITVSEHVREICQLKYIQPPAQKILQKNQRPFTLPQPYPQQRQFQNMKSACQKYKRLLMQMNEQTVVLNMKRLNQKYSKTNTISFNNAQSRGILYQTNLAADQRVGSYSQGLIP